MTGLSWQVWVFHGVPEAGERERTRRQGVWGLPVSGGFLGSVSTETWRNISHCVARSLAACANVNVPLRSLTAVSSA